MRPVANQQGQFFTTAKNHKFDSIEDIYVEKLKFKPIISQTGTFTYISLKEIIDYILEETCFNRKIHLSVAS